MGFAGQNGVPKRDNADVPRLGQLADIAGDINIVGLDFKAWVDQHKPTARRRRGQGKGHVEPVAIVAFCLIG